MRKCRKYIATTTSRARRGEVIEMSDTSDAKIIDTEYKTIESGVTVPRMEGFSWSQEIVQSVAEWNDNVKSLHESVLRGKKESEWLADKLQDAAVGMSVADYGNYLAEIDHVLAANNQAMMDTILTKSGSIS